MPRYKADLHSITKSGRLSQKHFLIIASQIIDILRYLHEKNYVHSDIKAQNIMIGLHDSSSNLYHTSFKRDINEIQKFQSSKVSSLKSVQYGGANPLRTCRIKEGSQDKVHHTVYNDMVRSHYLRPSRSVTYAMDENSRSSFTPDRYISDNSEDEDFHVGPRKKKANRRSGKLKRERKASKSPNKFTNLEHTNSNAEETVSKDDHVYIIDYGLATKFIDSNGEHKPFCLDQRRAHDGTLEFTSRDAHFGAHSRRSDLECFGYNLIYWSKGYLPWKDEKLKEQPEIVHRLKEIFMTDVKEMLKLLYGKDVPKFLGEYMQYVGQLEFDEEPNYVYLRGLFEKEFLKLGFKKSDMQLNLNEVKEFCEPIDRNQSEHDLMMASIRDLKTVTKLGFLVTGDSVDGVETLVKPNESMNLSMACKASPKNLRSKEKCNKAKRQKRQRKLTEKEIICEKIAKGKKLSVHEIATLDPEQIARDRAEKEYEKFDEKVYYQTPQRYKGNPTYAILEIENRLKNKQNGSSNVNTSVCNPLSIDIEPIKGYTKPMMDILKKQQMIVEQQIVIEQTTPTVTTYHKRNREGLRNVIKSTQKNITYQNEVNGKRKHQKRKTRTKGKGLKKMMKNEIDSEKNSTECDDLTDLQIPIKARKSRSKKIPLKRTKRPTENEKDQSYGDLSSNEEENQKEKRKRVRSRANNVVKNNVEVPETEEDSVYYDIPGEGSNDGSNVNAEIDYENDNEEEVLETRPTHKRLRRRDFSTSEENSNHVSNSSGSVLSKKRRRGRYYNDEDYELYTDEDEASNISSVSHATKSSASFKPRRVRGQQIISQDNGISTRNKIKSRSTSCSVGITENECNYSEHSDDDEDEGSNFESESGDGDESDEDIDDQGAEFEQDEVSDEDNDEQSDSEIDDDDDDSIDIKYSPIKTRHARRRINCFNMKQIRGNIRFKVSNAQN